MVLVLIQVSPRRAGLRRGTGPNLEAGSAHTEPPPADGDSPAA